MPELTGALPPWVSDIGVVSLMVLFGIALARNWLYTGGQVAKLLELSEKVALLWEKVATERQATIELLSDNHEPILKSNEAILRAVEQLQAQQEQIRYVSRRSERDRRT